MKRLEMFKRMQSECAGMVRTSMLAHNMSEAAMELRSRHTKVTVYVKNYAVSMTFYLSGRLVYETTDNVKTGKLIVVSDEMLKEFYSTKQNPDVLLHELVAILFTMAEELRKRHQKERENRKKHKEKSAPVERETALPQPFCDVAEDTFDEI